MSITWEDTMFCGAEGDKHCAIRLPQMSVKQTVVRQAEQVTSEALVAHNPSSGTLMAKLAVDEPRAETMAGSNFVLRGHQSS